jgi:para-nitrobenzyl esterase
MKLLISFILLSTSLGAIAQWHSSTSPRAKTANGILEGVDDSGINVFKGVPFAAPPVGDLRWKEPRPVKNWTGIRKADKFGPRAVQRTLYSDMMFRSDGMSEDCLYLNVWSPAKSPKERLPVLVYFFGGGLMAGDGSEYRYDGESMARRGVIAITVNYRLNIFGFFAHPELTRESPHHASGNYGFMDQTAALRWVKKNITAFGGDSNKITIGGESAGSFSVSAQMASPLSKKLIHGAIGESGSLLGLTPMSTLAEAEQKGLRLAEMAGVKSLAELRKLSAQQLLDACAGHDREVFTTNVDGYFFPKSPLAIYTAREQAQVPLLVGWNSMEGNYTAILGKDTPTIDNFKTAVQKMYGDKAADALEVYYAATDADVEQAATDLASDRFIGFSTWKWSDAHSRGKKPVYRYLYCHPRPSAHTAPGTPPKPPAKGAGHSWEIEYALGNLSSNHVYNWQPEDYTLSQLMQSYFVNFIKKGNPNGQGLPAWHPATGGARSEVMLIDVNTREEEENHRGRYLFMGQFLDM